MSINMEMDDFRKFIDSLRRVCASLEQSGPVIKLMMTCSRHLEELED